MDNIQIKQEHVEIVDDVIDLTEIKQEFDHSQSTKGYINFGDELEAQNGIEATASNLLESYKEAQKEGEQSQNQTSVLRKNKYNGSKAKVISIVKKTQILRPAKPKPPSPVDRYLDVEKKIENKIDTKGDHCNRLKPLQFQSNRTQGQCNTLKPVEIRRLVLVKPEPQAGAHSDFKKSLQNQNETIGDRNSLHCNLFGPVQPTATEGQNINTNNIPKRNIFNSSDSSNFHSDFNRGLPKGDMMSQLRNLYSENNQHSSDEDENDINHQVNKMRMRNGLPPIDCRRNRTSKCENKPQNSVFHYVVVDSPSQASNEDGEEDSGSNNEGDTNRSSPGCLIIDESPSDTTDTDSVLSLNSTSPRYHNSIYNIQSQAKRSRKKFGGRSSKACPRGGTNESGPELVQVGDYSFAIVNRGNLSVPRTYSSKVPDNSDSNPTNIVSKPHNNVQNIENSSTGSKDNNPALQKILSAIQNLKQESEVTIKKEQSRCDNLPESVANIGSSPTNAKSTNSASSKLEVFQCVPCKLRFDSQLDLKKHILSVHIKLYQCSSCPFRTLMPLIYQKHLFMHSGSSKSSECSGSGSPIQIKQLSSTGSSKSSTSSRTNSPIEIIEID